MEVLTVLTELGRVTLILPHFPDENTDRLQVAQRVCDRINSEVLLMADTDKPANPADASTAQSVLELMRIFGPLVLTGIGLYQQHKRSKGELKTRREDAARPSTDPSARRP